MRVVVDGMNVIGSRPDGWWRDRREAMRRLARQLAAHADRTGDDVMVVFDGRPFDLETQGIEVRFATRSGPDAADDDIAELAQAGVTVVTSDATLADRVRAAGGEVTGAGAFRRRLDQL